MSRSSCWQTFLRSLPCTSERRSSLTSPSRWRADRPLLRRRRCTRNSKREGPLHTWAWYLMAMALGLILLHAKTTVVRVAAGALLGPTSFFLVSNYAVWASGWYVSADAGRAGRMPGCRVAVLSQRSALDEHRLRAGLWRSCAGAADERDAGAGGAGGEVDFSYILRYWNRDLGHPATSCTPTHILGAKSLFS